MVRTQINRFPQEILYLLNEMYAIRTNPTALSMQSHILTALTVANKKRDAKKPMEQCQWCVLDMECGSLSRSRAL